MRSFRNWRLVLSELHFEVCGPSVGVYVIIGGWEKRKEGSQPGIQAQRPRTRTARTIRQINGARFVWWLARFWRNVSRSACGSRPRVQGCQPCCRSRNDSNFIAFAEDKERSWHLNARLALQKYGFREFMIFSSLKNRLRSRTLVTAVMFQNAWCFEESAPFSYTYHNFQISECVKFEESSPFSYTYHNFGDELRSGSSKSTTEILS